MKIAFHKSKGRGEDVSFSNENAPYLEKVEAIISEGSRLDKYRAECMGQDNAGEVKLANVWISALAWKAEDLRAISPEEHAKSKWCKFDCAMDWMVNFAELNKAPDGEIPNIGQRGQFMINVEGFDMLVDYDPCRFGGHIDSYVFRHYREGVEVKEPMPFSETGYKSAFIEFSFAVDKNNVKDAAINYVNMHSEGDVSKCNQMSLF